MPMPTGKIRFGSCSGCKSNHQQLVQAWHSRFGLDINNKKYLEYNSYAQIRGLNPTYEGVERQPVSALVWKFRFYTSLHTRVIDKYTGEMTEGYTLNVSVAINGQEWTEGAQLFSDSVKQSGNYLALYNEQPSATIEYESPNDVESGETFGNRWRVKVEMWKLVNGVKVGTLYGYSDWYPITYSSENSDTVMLSTLDTILDGPWYDPERQQWASWDDPLYFSETLDNSAYYIVYYNTVERRLEIYDPTYRNFLWTSTGTDAPVSISGIQVKKILDYDTVIAPQGTEYRFDRFLVGYQLDVNPPDEVFFYNRYTEWNVYDYSGTGNVLHIKNNWDIISNVSTKTRMKLKTRTGYTIKRNDTSNNGIYNITTPIGYLDETLPWAAYDYDDSSEVITSCGGSDILTINSPTYVTGKKQRWYRIII